MECPSCYEYFDGDTFVPRNLNCGHTFCEVCLIKIEQQRLTFCPICRTSLQKPFKAKKLPKNYLALEYANKQQELMKKSNFCPHHPRELMRHFCVTCVQLICMECIVDHSGHEFVRKEESIYILKENGDKIVSDLNHLSTRTESLISAGVDLSKDVKKRKVKVMQQIDAYFEKVVRQVLLKKAEVKLKYADALKVEEARIDREQENFEKHLSLIRFCVENVQRTTGEIENFRGKQIKGTDISNRLDNFKRQEEELMSQTDKLCPIQMSYPQIEFSPDKLEEAIKQVATVHHRTVKMTQKKICFFGDTNKIIVFDTHSEQWQIRTINKQNYEFLYYSAAVTLPNGDAFITGGGSSTTVFQFLNSKNDLLQKKSMNQMRKEHAAVICENFVYVMGGYDGVQNVFLNCCEVYNVKKDEWRYFQPMNISKCAFSATVVNNKFIYTFGGYDGQNRLDAIERYSIAEGDWQLLKLKLKFPLSNCACFCPEPDKVVVFGGGFSSGFSPYVEQIDIKTGMWKTLPVMTEGRDLRNKVCFVDDHAYAVGGLNSKAEKFNYKEKKWIQLSEYPLSDNLDSWACALTYIPQEYSNLVAKQPQIISAPGTSEESKEVDRLLEQERLIDMEIKQELEKFKLNKQLDIYNEVDDPHARDSLVVAMKPDKNSNNAINNNAQSYRDIQIQSASAFDTGVTAVAANQNNNLNQNNNNQNKQQQSVVVGDSRPSGMNNVVSGGILREQPVPQYESDIQSQVGDNDAVQASGQMSEQQQQQYAASQQQQRRNESLSSSSASGNNAPMQQMPGQTMNDQRQQPF